MIAGLGIDIVEVERIKEKIENSNGFREYAFSANEVAYCESKAHKYEHYAARFAAKEAFFKAIGTGWLNGTVFNEVTIANNENGKPEVELLGLTQTTISALAIDKIMVSLSHVKSTATAVVILEKY